MIFHIGPFEYDNNLTTSTTTTTTTTSTSFPKEGIINNPEKIPTTPNDNNSDNNHQNNNNIGGGIISHNTTTTTNVEEESSSFSQQQQLWCDVFDNQIICLPWISAGSVMGSEIPVIGNMIHICYAINAWLQKIPPAIITDNDGGCHDRDRDIKQQQQQQQQQPVVSSSVAVLSCPTGKTRTALVCACYLKYAGIVRCCRDGFCHFLEQSKLSSNNNNNNNNNNINKNINNNPLMGGGGSGTQSLGVLPSLLLGDERNLHNNNNNNDDYYTHFDDIPISSEDIYAQLPASLHTFFRNFDTAIDLGTYMNRKPLLLKAIAVQGVPVEDRPCFDLWDSRGNHIYTSHPHLYYRKKNNNNNNNNNHHNIIHNDKNPTNQEKTKPRGQQPSTSQSALTRTPPPETIKDDDANLACTNAISDNILHSLSTPIIQNTSNIDQRQQQTHIAGNSNSTRGQLSAPHLHHGHGASQWADEEGFYLVNKVVTGDFCLLCRFGENPHEVETIFRMDDTSKILFRYTNSTAFVSGAGPYELPASRVDLMRRYAHFFDPDDFLLSLMWEQHWNYSGDVGNTSNNDNILYELQQDIDDDTLLPTIHQHYTYHALEEGWKFIYQYHAANNSKKSYLVSPSDTSRKTFSTGHSKEEEDQDDDDIVKTFLQECATAGIPSELEQNQCPKHIIKLALLLCNYNFPKAETILLEGRLRAFWFQQPNDENGDGDGDDQQHRPNERTIGGVAANQQHRNNLDNNYDNYSTEGLMNDDGMMIASPSHLQDQSTNVILETLQKYHNFSFSSDSDSPSRSEDSNEHQHRHSGIESPTGVVVDENDLERNSQRYIRQKEALSRINSILDAVDITSKLHPSELVGVGLNEPTETSEPTAQSGHRRIDSTGLTEDSTASGTMMANSIMQQRQLKRPRLATTNMSYTSPIMRPHPGDVVSTLSASRISTLLARYRDNNQKSNPNNVVDSSFTMNTSMNAMQNAGNLNMSFGNLNTSIGYVNHNANYTNTNNTNLGTARLSTLSSFMGEHPLFPVVPRRTRQSRESVPIEDPSNDAALELLLKLNHPGVHLQDLLHLTEVSKEWNVPRKESEQQPDEHGGSTVPGGQSTVEIASPKKQVKSSHTTETSASIYGKPENPDRILTGAAAVMEEMLKRKQGEAAVSNKIEEPSTVDSGGHAKEAALAAMNHMLLKKQGGDSTDDKPSKPSAARGALLEDMLKKKLGSSGGDLAATAAKDATNKILLKKQGGDATDGSKTTASAVMEEMLKRKLGGGSADSGSGTKETSRIDPYDMKAQEQDPALKDDPRFMKYFKMRNMGLPDGAVKNAMMRDEVDPSILDLDPEKSYKSQAKPEVQSDNGDDPPLKDDPLYAKYYKMKKMGLPDGAVKNAMERDGVDPAIFDLDPEKSLKSQAGIGSKEDEGPPLKDDPSFAKYYKMRKMGLPEGAVRNAMERDGLDPSILDLNPEKSLKSQRGGATNEDDGPPIKDDPVFQKYFKMLKMGLPQGAVKNAMERDGVDSTALDLDPDKSFNSQRGGGVGDDEDDGPALQDDPAFAKYYKMRKMGLPDGAIKNSMERDGVDSSILDLDPEKSLKSQLEEVDTGVPLKDDPLYEKYFKMRKMGLPDGPIMNAMERDGIDPAVLNLDPEKSVEFQLKPSIKAKKPSKKKKRVRRKKIYWNPLDPNQIKRDSIWSMVKEKLHMSKLSYDEKEFDELFTESADPKDKKQKSQNKDAAKVKKSVQVIDGKRSMNGGIILQRLKLDYKDLAQMVDTMEAGKLDSTSIKALKELLPTSDEMNGLLSYMKQAGSSEEAKRAAYNDLSESEKYMYTMLDVSDAEAKFDCMLFSSLFRSRFDELMESMKIVEKACDEIRNSDKLRSVLAIILTVVNQINTGGEGNEALGFTLDALLKLNEAKAFDKKTSVLHYVVKVVQRNDESLLDVAKDLVHAKKAELVVLDSLCGDIKALKDEITPVYETVKSQAEMLEEIGAIRPLSTRELREQKTSVRNIAKVVQYNKIDHHTGRTKMERFVLHAKAVIDEALEYSDKVKDKFLKLLEYFGEDAGMASNDFFKTWTHFMAEFEKAIHHVTEVEKKQKKEQEKIRKEKEKLERSGLKGKDIGGFFPEKRPAPVVDSSERATAAPLPQPGSAIAAMMKKRSQKDASSQGAASSAVGDGTVILKNSEGSEANSSAQAEAKAATNNMLLKKKGEDDSVLSSIKPQVEGPAAVMKELLKRKIGSTSCLDGSGPISAAGSPSPVIEELLKNKQSGENGQSSADAKVVVLTKKNDAEFDESHPKPLQNDGSGLGTATATALAVNVSTSSEAQPSSENSPSVTAVTMEEIFEENVGHADVNVPKEPGTDGFSGAAGVMEELLRKKQDKAPASESAPDHASVTRNEPNPTDVLESLVNKNHVALLPSAPEDNPLGQPCPVIDKKLQETLSSTTASDAEASSRIKVKAESLAKGKFVGAVPIENVPTGSLPESGLVALEAVAASLQNFKSGDVFIGEADAVATRTASAEALITDLPSESGILPISSIEALEAAAAAADQYITTDLNLIGTPDAVARVYFPCETSVLDPAPKEDSAANVSTFGDESSAIVASDEHIFGDSKLDHLRRSQFPDEATNSMPGRLNDGIAVAAVSDFQGSLEIPNVGKIQPRGIDVTASQSVEECSTFLPAKEAAEASTRPDVNNQLENNQKKGGKPRLEGELRKLDTFYNRVIDKVVIESGSSSAEPSRPHAYVDNANDSELPGQVRSDSKIMESKESSIHSSTKPTSDSGGQATIDKKASRQKRRSRDRDMIAVGFNPTARQTRSRSPIKGAGEFFPTGRPHRKSSKDSDDEDGCTRSSVASSSRKHSWDDSESIDSVACGAISTDNKNVEVSSIPPLSLDINVVKASLSNQSPPEERNKDLTSEPECQEKAPDHETISI